MRTSMPADVVLPTLPALTRALFVVPTDQEKVVDPAGQVPAAKALSRVRIDGAAQAAPATPAPMPALRRNARRSVGPPPDASVPASGTA